MSKISIGEILVSNKRAMMMMIFAHLSSLPNALVSAQRRKHRSISTRPREGRTHDATTCRRRFLALLRKREKSTEKKRIEKREREDRDVCRCGMSDFGKQNCSRFGVKKQKLAESKKQSKN